MFANSPRMFACPFFKSRHSAPQIACSRATTCLGVAIAKLPFDLRERARHAIPARPDERIHLRGIRVARPVGNLQEQELVWAIHKGRLAGPKPDCKIFLHGA